MEDPITPQLAFIIRIESLATKEDAKELLLLVRAGQIKGEVDPKGDGMSILIRQCLRLEFDGDCWRWRLVLGLAKLGIDIRGQHLDLILDSPERMDELISAALEYRENNNIGTGKYEDLLLKTANRAIAHGHTQTMDIIEGQAKKMEMDLYKQGIAMFLCHTCMNEKRLSSETIIETLEFLKTKPSFDINAPHNGKPALFYCRAGGITRWLVDNGADVDLMGEGGETAMMEAWKGRAQDDVFSVLIEAGAELESGPDWKQIQKELQDLTLDNYPTLEAAWKRKILGEGAWSKIEGSKIKAEAEDHPAL